MQTLQFPIQGISVEGAIVDVETLSLRPQPNGIFTFGWLSGSAVNVIQAEDPPDCEALPDEIGRVWHTLPRPLYAYNKAFATDWIGAAIEQIAHIDHDTMEPWKSVAEQQSIKWPRLRELLRPPVFCYRWGVADYARERDARAMRRAIRTATSVNEVVSREAVSAAPYLWWQRHLDLLKDPQVRRELARLRRSNADATAPHSNNVHRLPTGRWTTAPLAAIVCHNMMDLQSQASLMLWQWNATSTWMSMSTSDVQRPE